jgi:hypothetical protein
MGYRSDIYLKTTKAGYLKMRDLIRRKSQAAYEFFITPDNMTIEKSGDREYINMKWEYLKWYDGYEDVDAVNAAIDEVKEEEPLHFIRIGEDMTDIEEIYGDETWDDEYFDPLSLDRYVTIYGKSIKDDDIIDNE